MMQHILKQFDDVFVWSYKDIHQTDQEIMEHKVLLYSDTKIVKHEVCPKKFECALKIEE